MSGKNHRYTTALFLWYYHRTIFCKGLLIEIYCSIGYCCGILYGNTWYHRTRYITTASSQYHTSLWYITRRVLWYQILLWYFVRSHLVPQDILHYHMDTTASCSHYHMSLWYITNRVLWYQIFLWYFEW